MFHGKHDERTTGSDRAGPYTALESWFVARLRVGSISYLSPLLAIIVGIVHASLAPVVVVGGAKPNLALVAVVLVTCLAGPMPGITWAFVTGLTVNLLVGAPLGSVPLALLVVAALVAGGQRVVGRSVWIYPVIATFVGSVVADVLGLLLAQLVSDAAMGAIPTDLILSAAVLNAVIAAILLLPARAIAARAAPDESTAWGAG
jgi:rod shape-determining protein MreD